MSDGTGNWQLATGNRQQAMRVGSEIADRLLKLAVAALRLAGRLPRDTAGRHISSQLVRCASGGGANYEEARAAESRDDFVHKVRIAAKEVRETVFWLALIQRSGWGSSDCGALAGEASELAAILGCLCAHRPPQCPLTATPPSCQLPVASCQLPVARFRLRRMLVVAPCYRSRQKSGRTESDRRPQVKKCSSRD